MLEAIGLYGLLLYLVNVVISTQEEEETATIEKLFLPQHEFVVERQKFVKKEKDAKYMVSLIIGPYVFTRNKKALGIGKNATFTCNGCHKLGKRTSALAKKISDNNNPNDYQLMSCQKDHACVPHSVQPLKKQFMSKMYSEVKNNPTRSIGEIYKEQRREIVKNLS